MCRTLERSDDKTEVDENQSNLYQSSASCSLFYRGVVELSLPTLTDTVYQTVCIGMIRGTVHSQLYETLWFGEIDLQTH